MTRPTTHIPCGLQARPAGEAHGICALGMPVFHFRNTIPYTLKNKTLRICDAAFISTDDRSALACGDSDAERAAFQASTKATDCQRPPLLLHLAKTQASPAENCHDHGQSAATSSGQVHPRR
ncbi:MAG: hypothetical protein Q7R66_15635 [Undibacterium sp.]|uniref:hypothetical protein n=1 Tax=Undibacterium sp. TaxID=1914977 RepID=UPI00271ADD6E|nr:hypothetical protein [Undibacterium sp.]MDO8653613.1 hypothetical protein [Undibacterium sp.]